MASSVTLSHPDIEYHPAISSNQNTVTFPTPDNGSVSIGGAGGFYLSTSNQNLIGRDTGMWTKASNVIALGTNVEPGQSNSIVIGIYNKVFKDGKETKERALIPSEQIKIGQVDLLRLVDQVQELKSEIAALGEHIRYMPGGVEEYLGKIRFDQAMENQRKREDEFDPEGDGPLI